MSPVIRIDSFPEENGRQIAGVITQYTGMYGVDELLAGLPVEFEVEAESFEDLKSQLDQLGCNASVSLEARATIRGEISSKATIFFKLSPLILVFFTILPVASSGTWQATWTDIVSLIAPAIFLYWFARRAKKVSVDDGKLIISSYRETITVPAQDIESISGSLFGSLEWVWITFRRPTQFGTRIMFFPQNRWFPFFSEHPIVEGLERLATQHALPGMAPPVQRSRASRLLKLGTGILGPIVLTIALVFYFTAGLVDTADGFFKAVNARDYSKAYQYVSEDFRASSSQQDLMDFLEKSGLVTLKETFWSNRSVQLGRGELGGSVIKENGDVVPIRLRFVKENGAWKIFSIQKPKAGLSDEKTNLDLPSEAEQLFLVMQSINKLARSVNAKDFTEFYRYVSHVWQKQTTVDDFNQAFKAFIDEGINLSPLEYYSPIFDEGPSVSEEGILSMKGHYPTKPSRVMFKLSYIYEGLNWRLASININFQPAN